MREIKFRAWDKEIQSIIESEHISEINFDRGYAYYIDSKGEHQRVGISDLMQFTGLLDKNGKEIFEGDIVQGDDFQRFSGNPVVRWGDSGSFVLEIHTGKSVYRETFFSFLQGEGHDLRHIEIIGNIYEDQCKDLC